jgi:hypothetical protein
VTPSSSATVTIHLEYQCVSLGYFSAGQKAWWDDVFVADQAWFVPGMARGGLLPAPSDGGDVAYGLLTALIIVQNLGDRANGPSPQFARWYDSVRFRGSGRSSRPKPMGLRSPTLTSACRSWRCCAVRFLFCRLRAGCCRAACLIGGGSHCD